MNEMGEVGGVKGGEGEGNKAGEVIYG